MISNERSILTSLRVEFNKAMNSNSIKKMQEVIAKKEVEFKEIPKCF